MRRSLESEASMGRTGIIGAMEEEVALLKEKMEIRYQKMNQFLKA